MLVSCSFELSESFSVSLGPVSMAILEVIPPDVVKATVGVTVTVVAVVCVFSVLSHDVLLVEQELVCVVHVAVDVES